MTRTVSRAAAALAPALAGVTLLAGVAQAAITPSRSAREVSTVVPRDPNWIDTDANSPSFLAIPLAGDPVAVADTPLARFPLDGPAYAILTTGDAKLADDVGAFASADLDGSPPPFRGDTAVDVTVLHIPLLVRPNANCLSFDFRFLSEEFPFFVGGTFNDAFIAEVNVTNWTTQGSAITAPANFAFDTNGAPVTINSSGPTAMSAAEAAGTAYGGATQLLRASTLVQPGSPAFLYLSIFDQDDRTYDSAVFVDNLVLATRGASII